MKIPFKTLFILILTFSVFLFINFPAQALSWDIPNFDVDIKIEENSRFSVTEDSTFIFTGDLNGLRRDITLEDSEKSSFCAQNPSLTCGGFEFLTFESLTVNNKPQEEGDYSLYEVTDSFSRYFRIEKRVKDEETFVSNESYSWEYTYNVYGGIQWLLNNDGDRVPFFYWNLLPESRGAQIESSTITIEFPESVEYSEGKMEIYEDSFGDVFYDSDFDTLTNVLTLSFQDLPSYGSLTMSYEFGEDELIPTGTIKYDLIHPSLGADVYFNNLKVDANSDNEFNFVPVDEYEIKFDRFGYNSEEFKIEVGSNETTNLEVDLTPTTWMRGVILLNGLLTVIGGFGVVYAPIFVYRRWDTKGKDVDKVKTIVPIYRPPENSTPYLLGSVKDEKVDKRDITGSIIDLAYRGFIKIKEIKKKKDYQLTKLEGKKGETLDEIEKDIMEMLFDGKTTVKTSSFKTKTTFYTKLNNIIKDIYKKLQTDGYFESNPETTRNTYIGMGVGALIFGIATTIFGTIAIFSFIGEPGLFTLGIALTVLGVGTLIAATHMPAKTKLGSKLLGDLKGFKMYLETAERFRLQGLKPEEFEKYLSYAVVFGVEKEWAKNFKDIYNGNPDWYEGSTDLVDAFFISNFVRNFSSATESSFTASSSSGFSSGGGWSGGGVSGGSFGGFSGGGGGGGSAGGW